MKTKAEKRFRELNTPTYVCFSCVSMLLFLVARLQDCVEAVCNKCAQSSGPKEIYHKWEGRKSAQGKEEDGRNGGERGAEWEKT